MATLHFKRNIYILRLIMASAEAEYTHKTAQLDVSDETVRNITYFSNPTKRSDVNERTYML